MHCIFLIRPIVRINHEILYIMWALNYVVIFIMSVDYCIITCSDPVDKVLIDET